MESGPSCSLTRRFLVVAVAVMAAPVFAAGDSGGAALDYLQSGPVVREKSSEAVSPTARQFIQQRDKDTVRVWVFFTDKRVYTSKDFVAAAARVQFSDRAEHRRTRTGCSQVLFADLPVSQRYIEQVAGLGAIHRRSSRWLNAASFSVPSDRLEQIAALPFVAAISPVARFQVPKDIAGEACPGPTEEAQADGTLEYGPSQTQVFQIGAAALHVQGYSGRGVALTIADTGFRKTHAALASHVTDGRVLAEYDFVMNDTNTSLEPGDPLDQWNHGTLVWSVTGGYAPRQVIGPAFGANFILCKTEDIPSESPVEEDNWVAALEFADSVGTDVISTSLSYSDWYSYSDMDGQTAVISMAASTCDALGIVLVVAAGNAGPAAGTIRAPADAFNILTAGAVDQGGLLASFSSRGPTFDGRTKPEVCALGVDAYGANAAGDGYYRYASGTSLATPLIAGAACLLIEARPDLSPRLVREALKATASQALSPDNSYGWGIIDLRQAVLWPVRLSADVTRGQAPLEVSFSNSSWLEASSVSWNFGDGAVSTAAAPSHTYLNPGVYDVTLSIETDEGPFARTIPGMVLAHSDSLRVADVQAMGSKVRVDIDARNFLPLDEIEIPLTWDGPLGIKLDSFSTVGLRTSYFSTRTLISVAPSLRRATYLLRTAATGTEPSLPPGSGPVVSVYFTVPYQSGTGVNPLRLISYGNYAPGLRSGAYSYTPTVVDGSVRLGCCLGVVGDVDGDGSEYCTMADISTLIDHLFISGTPLGCWTEADANQSGGAQAGPSDVSIVDVSILIDYLFISGQSQVLPDCP